MKKYIILSLVVLAAVGGGAWYYFQIQPQAPDLKELGNRGGMIAKYAGDAAVWEQKIKEVPDRVESYSTLGMAYKALADYACEAKIKNCQELYRQALEVYKKGIDLTQRKNSLMMTNAANMEIYLGEYAQAEEYFKEAISLSPGEAGYYKMLAELYEYQMHKSKEEVLAVYDSAAKRVLNPASLEKLKQGYLERNK